MPGSPCPTCGIVGWVNVSDGVVGSCVICDARLRWRADGTWELDDRDD